MKAEARNEPCLEGYIGLYMGYRVYNEVLEG